MENITLTIKELGGNTKEITISKDKKIADLRKIVAKEYMVHQYSFFLTGDGIYAEDFPLSKLTDLKIGIINREMPSTDWKMCCCCSS